ncbi:hypothetical protein Lal_00025579 [Lupinus albus]|uniref:Uncharacterized protein n=1 Tax=Lupinus albus TaxID=3870 RepID=A0A6A5NZ74_LUPAL|nr:hypothetical protein Lalb_Chr10g0101311 [Lupinus albus]KAF1890246.1 hypothetical protein Lal_00025579 [Lupinus albus]
MGVSFKVSKNGTRYHPKPLSLPLPPDTSESQKSKSNSREPQSDLVEAGENISRNPNSSESLPLADGEASFTLNLFPDGYSIVKPFVNETANQSHFPKLLNPYDRSSESLFLAIESGHLPGDILDDIPAKYVDGALICEVRDYRRCSSERGAGVVFADSSPTVNKVCLKMSLENIVKDIPSITDKSWTYGDLMEAESKIVKALQPKLHLDPTPKLDWLCKNPAPTTLSISMSNLRRKRSRHMPEFSVTSSSKSHGKKMCIDRVPESSTNRLSDSGIPAPNAIAQQTFENSVMQNVSPSIAMDFRPRSILPDSSVPSYSMMSNQSSYQMEAGTPRSVQDHGSVSAMKSSAASPIVQNVMVSYANNANSNGFLLEKRENPDGQTSSLSNIAKRTKLASTGVDAVQQKQLGSHVEALKGSDMNWQSTLLQQQAMARGIYGSGCIQKFPQNVFEGGLNQDAGSIQFTSSKQGMRLVVKEEQFEMEKLDAAEINRNKSEMKMETSNLDPQQLRFQQRLPRDGFMRSNISQTTWNNVGQHSEKEARKEDQLQKRKPVQSPHLSTGALPHSPSFSKSGDFSNGLVGPCFGSSSVATAPGVSQKEKTAIPSAHAAIGTPSLAFSTNDSTQRQHQAQLAAKRRSNSLPKTPAVSGVGSPASVSTGGTLNANSPSIGTPAVVDQGLQIMLERFSKIEMVTTRHQLNSKKNKGDDYPMRKQNTYSQQHLVACLSNARNSDGIIDETISLSKSLTGGSMNVCKTRHLSFFFPERVIQGNVVSIVPRLRTRMIMSEKPSDGTVAMHYGDIDEDDFVDAEDHLPTLPNTHAADLLAEQFSSLMAREGYVKEDDRVQVKQNRVSLPSGSQSSLLPNNSLGEMQQYGEIFPGQSSNEVAKAASVSNVSLNLPQNLVANQRMLPPGNPQVFQMSQGLLSGVSMASRPQQLDSQLAVQQQQQLQQNQHNLLQQQNPLQRSMMLGQNQVSHLNAIGQNSYSPLGNMLNKPSPLQLQMLQQQGQQQMQRRMMMGLGTAVGMGNLRNGIVGLGPMGNPIGIGAARGIPGTGISTPMTSMSGMGSMGQNPINLSQASNISNVLSQQLKSGTMTQSQAELLASRIRIAQNHGSMLGSPQSSIAGISGARQMHSTSTGAGFSMLSQSLNRANINTLQRAMGPMGPPKLMAEMNPYMNQQQQDQQQQNQHQLQLQQQQQHLQHHLQQQLQQQERNSQLEAVVTPPQVGSQSTMGVPPMNQQVQQQAIPQQMSQRTPMSLQQMSSGTIHAATSAGIPEACPQSPQLSSQTLGPINNITNSHMDMQDVNKSNSVSNAQ